jgi:site-specific DNA recombinase
MQSIPNNNLRLALYCRVSTEEQREGQTIESQIKELEQFATSRWTIIRTYKDEGWSGSILARPELDRLRDDASKHLFDAVLINDVDRLARDVTHLGIIKRDLERHGLRVIFRKLPGEASPAHNLLINVLGSFAEFERELIADRTRRGKRYKVETRKQYLGAIPPYGFQYTPKSSAASGESGLRILPGEAAVVGQVYRWVGDEGLSVRKVVQKLNASRVLPRKAGSKWQGSTVLRILHSEVYKGLWHYNKHEHCEPLRRRANDKYHKRLKSSLRRRPRTEWIEVPLPETLRIIDPALWRRVQEQLRRNTAFSPRHSKHRYFLTGLIRCGGCNGSYVGDPSHGRFAYRCIKRCRKYLSIREEFLNVTVWDALERALQNPNAILRGLSQHKEVANSNVETMITAEVTQIDAEELRILQAYRLEILSTEQLKRELLGLKARRSLIQMRTVPTTTSVNTESRNVKRSVKDYCIRVSRRLPALNWDERQRLLRVLVKQILFRGDRVTISGHIPTEEGSSTEVPPVERIASTTSWDCDPNTRSIHFELTCLIKRDADGASDSVFAEAGISE